MTLRGDYIYTPIFCFNVSAISKYEATSRQNREGTECIRQITFRVRPQFPDERVQKRNGLTSVTTCGAMS